MDKSMIYSAVKKNIQDKNVSKSEFFEGDKSMKSTGVKYPPLTKVEALRQYEELKMDQ